MEIDEPEKNVITIYSKSGCPNCLKSKNMLKEKSIAYTVIDCDEYLLENKQEFLATMNQMAKTDVKMFPMIFYGSSFIGGYNELLGYVNKMLDFDADF